MDILEILKAIFFGIVEGITEWLPISSTGHMILVDEFLKLNISPEFTELFFIVIQLGAVLAVAVMFFGKLNPFSGKKTAEEKRDTWTLWFKVLVASVPAAVIGLLIDDILDEYLYSPIIVAAALVLYGIAFILIEHKRAKRAGAVGDDARVTDVRDLTYTDALKIGAFQVLSLIPGTSRSGSTMLGGLLSGVSRAVSAEFSFFMAIPIIIGASGLKILKFIIAGSAVTLTEITVLLVGVLVSFLVSLVVIKFLMDFVRRHSLSVFGIYRIILGAVVLGYFAIKALI